MIMCCIVGTIVMSLMVLTLTNTLSMSLKERMVYRILQKLKKRDIMERAAIKIITLMG